MEYLQTYDSRYRVLGSVPSTANSSNSSAGVNHEDAGHGHHADDHLVIITITTILIVGAMTHQTMKASQVAIPYTSVLYVVLSKVMSRR